MSRERTGVRDSREQSSRENNDIHDDMPLTFESSGPLPDITARAGYQQRWIRCSRANETDQRNLFNAQRKGWSPREANSVPKKLQWLCSQREGMGGVIGTHDMILMERPMEVSQQAAAHNKQKRKSLEVAVKNTLFNEHNKLGGSATGLTAPSIESDARVERGAPRIAED